MASRPSTTRTSATWKCSTRGCLRDAARSRPRPRTWAALSQCSSRRTQSPGQCCAENSQARSSSRTSTAASGATGNEARRRHSVYWQDHHAVRTRHPGKGSSSPAREHSTCSVSAPVVACALQPERVDIKTLYGTAGGDGARALAKIDEVLNTADCIRIVYSNTIDVVRIRAATHGSAVFRKCAILHYEHTDLRLQDLQRLMLPDGDAVAESLKSHLVSKEDTPQDSFAGGTIVRLQEPHHIDDTDTRSPIVVGHTTAGDTGASSSPGQWLRPRTSQDTGES